MSEYPSTAEFDQLKKLANDVAHPKATIDYLMSIWHFGDWGYKLKRGRDILHKACWKFELHTGGWSGNEELIETLGKTFFWFIFWQKSIRGGHYWFEIPDEFMKSKQEAR